MLDIKTTEQLIDTFVDNHYSQRWISVESLEKWLLHLQHKLNDDSDADIMIMNMINKLKEGT